MVTNFTKGIFIKDENTKGLYIPFKQPQQFYFSFLRVAPSKTEILIKNGADYVLQSFSKLKATDKVKTKILHSGLIRLIDYKDEVYFGDNVNLKSKRKDFFIVKIKDGVLTMYYFKKRNPRNKVKFSKDFLKSIISK